MAVCLHIARAVLASLLVCATGAGNTPAAIEVSGRVIDDTGAGVGGARVEIRPADGSATISASSDRAGNFAVTLPAAGDYAIRAERLGFYVYQAARQHFDAESSELTITLNHLQEFSERIDVSSSAPAIDTTEPADRKELDNTEILTVPYPAPGDYRNALPLMDGVVQDNSGRPHFNGGQVNQTNYTLDGFNISDPVTGALNTQINIESIQSMTVETSRFSAENGRGSAGVVDLQTKMGDDRFRFAGTNFVPGISSESGFHISKWTPRLEVSGPLAKGRAWFHNGIDGTYINDIVPGLPRGQNRTGGIAVSDLSRLQVNLTPANIFTGSFLVNMTDLRHDGLSFLDPLETTTNHRHTMYMTTLRDQAYFSGGELLDVGFADTRGELRLTPQGGSLFEITPFGDRGNYFENLDQHFYRQQWIANVFLPVVHAAGTHQLKFGIDFEREAFHQKALLHDYEVLRADNSVARHVTFGGSPFQGRKNFEGAQYIQDAWKIREGLLLDTGLRVEWNEIVRDLEVGPRIAVAWAPSFLRDTKISAGWGIYYDAINLDMLTRHQAQASFSTFYLPDGIPQVPVTSYFLADEQDLETPYYRTTSASLERKLPGAFYLTAGYTRRTGAHGFTFMPESPIPVAPPYGNILYQLRNARRDRYDAVDVSLRHTFAAQFEWFIGYTRSSARSNAAVDYSLLNPIFAAQAPGPYPWNTPNRAHMWGWAPLPKRILPQSLQFVTRNTTAGYLVEYRTGFPFGVVDENGFMIGAPNSMWLPAYFNINLHLERKFSALHYLWAWRFGFNNLSNNGNPNVVNNVIGTPAFLTYGRGQVRAFSVRLRLLGRN